MIAITREQGDEFYSKIMEMRNKVALEVKEKARQVEQVSDPFWNSAPLVRGAYREFGIQVHNEFDGTICEDLAKLFLSTSKLYFYSRSKLQGEVRQILEEKCPEASH